MRNRLESAPKMMVNIFSKYNIFKDYNKRILLIYFNGQFF